LTGRLIKAISSTPNQTAETIAMRRPGKAGGFLVLVIGLFSTGCVSTDSTHTAFINGIRGLATPGPDCLHVQTTFIEQPAGDAYLNKGLWAAIGKPLPHELTTLLARNGIRVGVITGNPPGEFDRLISSEHTTVSPTFRTMQPGKPKVIAINGPIARVEYSAVTSFTADPTPTTGNDAECALSLTAWPADNNRVRLVCELLVQHGDRQSWIAPTTDGTAFTRQERKNLETFPTLSWEITLSPGDYLVVGATDNPVGTLGQAFFFPMVNGVIQQRVFVTKAGHGMTSETPPLATRPTK